MEQNAQGAREKEILFDFSCYFTGFIVVLLRLSFWSTEKEVKHNIQILFNYIIQILFIKLW